jgi:hypothetical protein
VWSEFTIQNPESLLEIERTFEGKKRGLTAQPTEVTMPYPYLLFKTYIPNITAPLRIAATASLGQITFNLGNSDFTLSYKSGESENPPTIKIVPITLYLLTTENILGGLKHSLKGETFVRMCSKLSVLHMGNYGICRLFKEFLHNFRVKSEFFFKNSNCLRITGFLLYHIKSKTILNLKSYTYPQEDHGVVLV